jgi:TetR/AcrR family transcriptional repressor of nem operon
MKAECDSKIRLLATARELIWRSSYGSVSVDDICEKANVKKGSFYYFFKSKAELAVAASEAYWNEELKPKLDKAFAPDVPPLERLERYFSAIEENQTARKKECGHVLGCPFASIGAELSTQDESIRSKSAEISLRCRRYLEGAIGDAQKEGLVSPGDCSAKAEELLSYTMGVLFQARINNSLEPLRHLKTGGMRIIGARAEAAV